MSVVFMFFFGENKWPRTLGSIYVLFETIVTETFAEKTTKHVL